MLARLEAPVGVGDGVDVVPTLDREHLSREFMTPIPRYRRLCERMTSLAGGRFQTLIKGLDQLQVTHDNVMLEACNTSMQLHFQVSRDEEHVRVSATVDGENHDLGSRAHHYTALCLARLRLQDQTRAEIPESSHGWITSAELDELGIERGPSWSRLLREAEDLQLDGELADRAAALEWLRGAT